MKPEEGYVVGSNGVFEEYEDDLFSGMIRVEGIPSLPKIKEGIRIIFKKMPLSVYQTSLSFLEWCRKQKKSEGMLLYTYSDKKWGLECPDQWCTAGSVCAHPEERAEEFHDVVGDVHSHPDMGSWHSGTDSLDERKHRHGIFIVASNQRGRPFHPFTADVTIYSYVRGRKFELDVADVVDMNGVVIENAVFPEEWKQRFRYGACKYPECKDADTRKRSNASKRRRLSGYHAEGRRRIQEPALSQFDNLDYPDDDMFGDGTGDILMEEDGCERLFRREGE